LAESLRIDDGGLLDRTRVWPPSSVIVGRKLAGRALVEVGETRTVLREELIGLDDDYEAGTALLVSAGISRRRQAEDLAADQIQSEIGGASSASCVRMICISSRSAAYLVTNR